MFSGLIETKTKILAIEQEADGILLRLARPEQFDDLAIGDSVASNGCCLTIVALDEQSMSFQAGEETLAKTTLGQLQVGSLVNSERALALGDRLGGHLVSGHVDGVGRLSSRRDHDDWSDMVFECPEKMLRQMAPKASITVQGVSLTLVDVTDTGFSVALIPHTLAETTLGELQLGDSVNLETDILAKYVEQQLKGVITALPSQN